MRQQTWTAALAMATLAGCCAKQPPPAPTRTASTTQAATAPTTQRLTSPLDRKSGTGGVPPKPQSVPDPIDLD